MYFWCIQTHTHTFNHLYLQTTACIFKFTFTFAQTYTTIHIHKNPNDERRTKNDSSSLLFWNRCRFKCMFAFFAFGLNGEKEVTLWQENVVEKTRSIKMKSMMKRARERENEKRLFEMRTDECNSGSNIYFTESHNIRGEML